MHFFGLYHKALSWKHFSLILSYCNLFLAQQDNYFTNYAHDTTPCAIEFYTEQVISKLMDITKNHDKCDLLLSASKSVSTKTGEVEIIAHNLRKF